MQIRNVFHLGNNEEFLDKFAEAERYQDAREVLNDCPPQVQQKDFIDSVNLELMREAAQAGFLDLDNGRFSIVRFSEIEEFISCLGHQSSLLAKNISR